MLFPLASEVLTDGVQGVRLGFFKCTAELRLDSVHKVEEISFVHLKLAAAQPIIRAENKMITEDLIFVFTKSSLGDQAKISNIFLFFSSPTATVGVASSLLQRKPAVARALCGAFDKPPVARLKYCAKHAIAGFFLTLGGDKRTGSQA